MRAAIALLLGLGLLALAPQATAHGALTLNEFDTYAISDFEGQEDSFPWEGWEIWDIYTGDGYSTDLGSHAVYLKGNFAGDGTLRPSGGEVWELRFRFNVGNASFERSIAHDGTDVSTDFERLDWQIADGNVFQVHAWVPVASWEDQAVTDLVVTSLVDGALRDTAPGGIHDPATGAEVPVEAPATPVFPPLGEGRIVDAVPLTGPQKFLDVALAPGGDGAFTFTVQNPLPAQGQHFMFQADDRPDWNLDGAPAAVSLNGSDELAFTLRLAPGGNETIEPLPVHLLTDIGGKRTYYAYLADDGVALTEDPALAVAAVGPADTQDAPAVPVLVSLVALALLARRRTR